MAVLKLAVCSRLRESEALPVKLRLLGTLRLEPLTTEQVEEYLHGAGPTARRALHGVDHR